MAYIYYYNKTQQLWNMTMKHTVFEKVTSGSLQSTGKNINHIDYSGTQYIAFVKENKYP